MSQTNNEAQGRRNQGNGTPEKRHNPRRRPRRIELSLYKIKCVETMGGLLEGRTEPRVGAVLLTSSGQVVKSNVLNVRKLGNNDVEEYPQGRQLIGLNLPEDRQPKEIVVGVVLAD